MMTGTNYNVGDSTYQALGAFEGISKLVDDFYNIMDSEEEFKAISTMHTEAEQIKREKLCYFLCGWTGGKESYHEHFGKSISMPGAHAHLNIGVAERDMWLDCMAKALQKQGYDESLQNYMLKALSQPAEIIRQVSEQIQSRKHLNIEK